MAAPRNIPDDTQPYAEYMATGDTRPIPDPTRLTTEQLIREVNALKEIVYTRLDAMDKAMVLFNENITRVPTDTDKQISHLRELHDSRFDELMSLKQATTDIMNTRLEGMDKAVQLLQDISDRLPIRIDEKIDSLKNVHDEKFSSIQTQFRERDVRTEQSSKDSKVAVDAALQAAKEAVGEQNKSSAMAISKSEASVVKQIDQMGLLIQTGAKAVDDKFSDIKDRLTRIEGKGEGAMVADTSHQTSSNFVITIVSVVIAFASVLVAIFMAIHKS